MISSLVKVLYCSEQCSASIATGSGLLWDSESCERFLSITLHLSSNPQSNIFQYLWSRSSLNLMIWWLRFMIWIKMTMSIVEMRRNKWKKGSENHCTSIPFHLVKMSASKVSAGNLARRKLRQARRPYGSMSNPMADLHNETGNHQDQVKVLIERTASSLDNTALKMLFVSVQQNNIDLCSICNKWVCYVLIVHEIWEWPFPAWPAISGCIILSVLFIATQMTIRLNLIQEELIFNILSWFGHSYVSGILNSVNWY